MTERKPPTLRAKIVMDVAFMGVGSAVATSAYLDSWSGWFLALGIVVAEFAGFSLGMHTAELS